MIDDLSSDPWRPERTRDVLFLIEPGFADPAYPGAIFYCWQCALLEGVLASFPMLAESIDVVRVPWAKPRLAVMSATGAANPSLPLLVLAQTGSSDSLTGYRGACAVIDDHHGILSALSDRHGFPLPHP